MNKRWLAGIITAAVLGAVVVAGCTSPTTTPPTPSTSGVVSPDPFLDKFVASMERELSNDTTVYAWAAKWQTGTAVSIEAQFKNVTSNQDLSLNRTVIRFASVGDATNYVTNNTAGYVVTTNVTKAVSLPYKAYELVNGSAPTVYRAWTKISTQPPRTYTIEQINEIVVIDSVSVSASPPASVSASTSSSAATS